MILFPRRNGKTTEGDASAADVKQARKGENVAENISSVLPIVNAPRIEEIKISDAKPTENAYKTLRKARSDARYAGIREKRAKAKAEEAEAKKK